MYAQRLRNGWQQPLALDMSCSSTSFDGIKGSKGYVSIWTGLQDCSELFGKFAMVPYNPTDLCKSHGASAQNPMLLPSLFQSLLYADTLHVHTIQVVRIQQSLEGV